MTSFQKILENLEKNDVAFVLIGGLAAVAHGSAYVTADIDICYDRSDANLKKLAKALVSFRPRLRGVREKLPFQWDEITIKHGMNFTLETDSGDIDLLGEVSGLGNYQQAKTHSEIAKLYDMNIAILTLDGLIKTKEATGRPKDQAHLKELRALQELKKQQK